MMKLEVWGLGDLFHMLSQMVLMKILNDSSFHPKLDVVKWEEPNDVLQQTE